MKPLLIALPFLLLISGKNLFSFANYHYEPWSGDYFYEENPVKSEAGYSMVMEWHLSVLKNDSGMLEVNGQQTFLQLKTKLKDTGSELTVIYDQLLDGDAGSLKKGDVLFKLTRTVSGLTTQWRAMKPRLTDGAPEVGNCFQQKKQ